MNLDVDLQPPDLSSYEDGLNDAIDMSGEAGEKSSDAFAGAAGTSSTIVTSTDTANDLI